MNAHPSQTASVIPRICECGAELPASVSAELCPRCLLLAGADMLLPEEALGEADIEERPLIGRQFGKYELLEEIARGGMGIVYRARQIELDRVVAIKLLLFGEFSSDEFVRRFKAEASAAALLQHPGIVAIHEIGQHAGQHFFSMEYVPGRNLAEVVRERPMAADDAAECMRAVAEAVHYAHEKGILHRDLKPSNVLIDAAGKPRLTDFGLAKRFDQSSELTITGHVLGSPNYMPPEQAAPNRGAVGPYSDIYSLGAILYHLLTGRPPAVSDSLEGTLLAALHDEPIAPRLLNRSVPRDLETICLKCLAKNPANRYATANALAEDLGRYLRREPIKARPVTPLERLLRWCRRKPAAASALGLLGLITCGSLVVAGHLSQLHEKARHDNYRSEVSRAHDEWQQGNFAEAFFYLQRQVPHGKQADLRGFEWRHLWQLAQGNCSTRLPLQNDVVSWTSFSQNGKSLATFGWDRREPLQVWDISTQRRLWSLTDATSVAGYSPDGRTLIAGRRNGAVVIHEASNGRVMATLPGLGPIIAFANGAGHIVTRGSDGVLHVRTLPEGKSVFTLTNQGRRYFDVGRNAAAAISPDGNWLALVRGGDAAHSKDQGIDLWNVAGQRHAGFLPGAQQFRVLQFSPDSKRMAAGDADGLVLLWRWDTAETNVLQAHKLPVQSLAFSADGRMLASGSSDEAVKLWDVKTLKEESAKLRGQVGVAWSLAFSPREPLLACGSRDMPVNIWNLAAIADTAPITNINSEKVGNFAFSPNSRWMAAGCRDNRARVWDVKTKREHLQLRGVSYVVAFTSDNNRLLVANEAGEARWWNFLDNTSQRVPEYEALGEITCVEISPDRRVAGLGHKSGAIQMLEIDSGKILGTYAGHRDAVVSLAFTPDGRRFASGARDKHIRLWSRNEPNKSQQVCTEHKGAVVALSISSDGRTMASGCSANSIRFWNLEDTARSPGARNWHRSSIRTLTFSPDNTRVISGSEDRTVKLWDFAARRELATYEFEAPIRLTAFSPDGNNLAVVTDGGALHLLAAPPLAEADREWQALFSSR